MATSDADELIAPPSNSRGLMAIQVELTMAAIATPVLIARVCARIKHNGRLQPDDYLMILSLVFGLVATGLLPSTVMANLGSHIRHVNRDQLSRLFKLAYIGSPFSFLALLFGRISFAVSLLQWTGTIPWRRWLLYFIIATQIASTTFSTFVVLFLCNPVRKFWDFEAPGTCLNHTWRTAPGFLQGGFNIFADLVLAIMPSLVIAKLNLKRSTKAGLILLMGLGICNVAAAIISVVLTTDVFGTKDPTHARALLSICGGIQIYLVIIVASIPFLRPLFAGTQAFSWAYYSSLLGRYTKLGSTTSDQRRESGISDDILCGKGEKELPDLPHVNKERFVTTKLRNAGMPTESGFHTLRTIEEGPASRM